MDSISTQWSWEDLICCILRVCSTISAVYKAIMDLYRVWQVLSPATVSEDL